MNIITKEKHYGRLIDGVETILSLDDEEFNKVIERLKPKGNYLDNIYLFYATDECQSPKNPLQLGLEQLVDNDNRYIGRSYYSSEKFFVSQVLECLVNILPKGLKQYERIQKLLSTRNLETFKARYSAKNDDESKIIDKIFEMLSSKELFEKFLDYDNNTEAFAINNHTVEIDKYLKYLGKFFGNKDKDGNVVSDNSISRDFYIPNLQLYKQRYSQIFDNFYIDKYVNPEYTFSYFTSPEYITYSAIRRDDEPEWTINENLYNSVYDNMPNNLSLEEQAIYIYGKLCKIFTYDNAYFFRDRLDDGKYSHTFSKEHLESLTPNSMITCWDFSRVFSKFVNEIDVELEAAIISSSPQKGHFLAGFYTDKVSVMLEAINPTPGNLNDLTNAKNGIRPSGIKIISDRDGLIDKAINNVFPKIYGKEQITTQDYLESLSQIPRQDAPNNLEGKINSFIEAMKDNHISGNEAAQSLNAFFHSGFFGDDFKKAYLGIEDNQNGEKTFKRLILMTQSSSPDSLMYLLESDSLHLTTHTAKEIFNKLNSGEFFYENSEHTIDGMNINAEEK